MESRYRRDMMRLILDHDPETINSADLDGKTALHVASSNGDLDTVSFLIDNKVTSSEALISSTVYFHEVNPRHLDNFLTDIKYLVSFGKMERWKLVVKSKKLCNVFQGAWYQEIEKMTYECF